MKKKTLLIIVMALIMMFAVSIVTMAGFFDWLTGGEDTEEVNKVFTIGVIPSQNQGKVQVAMNKLEEHLEDELEKEVKVDVYPDYNGVVEAMNYDQVDMAYFGPLTYVLANHDSGAKAIITQAIDGEPFYHSYLITHKSSSLNSIEEVIRNAAQIDFAFGDPNSTSGTLIPGIALRDSGITPDSNFKSLRYTGAHDATALAVENKQVDVGAIDSAIFKTLIKNGKIDRDKFKVIWKSNKLFQYPWAVNKNIDTELIPQLRQAFYKIKDQEILDAFGGADKFVKAEDEDYEAIREAAKKAGRI